MIWLKKQSRSPTSASCSSDGSPSPWYVRPGKASLLQGVKNLRGAVHAVLGRFYQHQPQFDHLLNGQGQVAMLRRQAFGELVGHGTRAGNGFVGVGEQGFGVGFGADAEQGRGWVAGVSTHLLILGKDHLPELLNNGWRLYAG